MAVSRQTVYKWLGRAKAADVEPVPGDPGAALQDRSSQPHASPRRLPRARQSRILKHHRQRLSRITHLYAVGDHPVLRTRGDAGGWEDASGVPGLGGTGGGVRSLSSSRSR
jgi:hypothetical protein